jgi:hypothetical protein
MAKLALRATKNDDVFTYGIGVTRGIRLAHLGLTVANGGGLSSLRLGDGVGDLRWSTGFGDTVYGGIGSWGSSSFSRRGVGGCQAMGQRQRISGKRVMDFGAQGVNVAVFL